MSLSYLLLYLNFGLLVCAFAALLIFMFQRSKKQGEHWEKLDLHTNELPPGVYILPPGAPDPSTKKRKRYY